VRAHNRQNSSAHAYYNKNHTISSPPQPQITLTRTPDTIAEGGAVTYTFSRAPASTGPLTVNYEVAGTAKYTLPAGADDDYTVLPNTGYPANVDGAAPADGTIAFADGETTKAITITAKTDSVSDPDETVSIQLKPPTTADAYIVGTADALVTTITDVVRNGFEMMLLAVILLFPPITYLTSTAPPLPPTPRTHNYRRA
jgi:hypothetical protein